MGVFLDRLVNRFLPAKPRTLLTPQETRDAAVTFQFWREWACSRCHARLKIRTRAPREDGPSNFVMYPKGHLLAGHSQVPADQLNWNGLAEEREWKTDPVVCPACRRGLTVTDYKAQRRLQ